MFSFTGSLAAFVIAGCVAPASNEVSSQDFDARLIKVGANVPNATVTVPGGKPVKLYSLIKGKKAALINFWFFH